ncbi:UDP-N-acetylmuramoyl-L-alanyl-D-glutamate--2,6-diaminopimelate ligase [Rhizobacter sp. AJA081-3]|uniref:UDP-N-acetylmuramoyl-L-alanyl-D-glutamate--2, 6-diaminopimelate ligase n=1 Tax=Rhizobacter sp. AJA081-3 TaxID=2753607 RepID=UPI001AE07D68|nr:UDP-N-acetylmuramoyl-L-alanyl-D-glutamate--2,6-diaminopimelate ligase [Rhizobacter sp. AJA081-3]QTN24160.1 UDP-N-acetylmuramoyl-L-alanyl-D-glutamate--2,6-diaminopimelate ligase [Rhizobacter sp. AJA081-3]
MALQRLGDARAASDWLAQRGVRSLAVDSRRVQPGDAFIAWPGHALDGRQYVGQALAAGAVACLVEADGVEAFEFGEGAPVAAVAGLKSSTGEIADGFYGRPSELLQVVATTGTNGKTSTAWWTAQALSQLGRRCGVIGTLGIGEPSANVASTGLTTPDPVTLQQALRRFADEGFAACAIEASSIGIVEQRLAGTRIAVALFTNFTQDHLDFHGSMASYWEAKSALFDWPGLRAAILNVDDPQGAALAERLRGLDCWTYSVRGPARLRASDIAYRDGGLAFEVIEGDQRATVRSTLIGEYNVSNLLAVIGGLRALGVPLAEAAQACAVLTPVPGRMQRVEATRPGPEVVVDYAHSPDALEKALEALRPFATQRGGRLWCVFGCGGNRDTAKRPLMGGIAQRLADRVVLTSDNPRHEPPAFILLQIVAGLAGSQERVNVIEDRRKAIAHAVREAGANDVVLIAGKGHEDYQEIAGNKLPFSDVDEARFALEARA